MTIQHASYDMVSGSDDLEQEPMEPQFVIQRTSETVREWWTGSQWSSELSDARRYVEKPDASVVAGDEMAKALLLAEIDD